MRSTVTCWGLQAGHWPRKIASEAETAANGPGYASSGVTFANAGSEAAGITIDYANPPDQLVGHKGKTWIYIDNRGDYYYQTIITEQAMTQEVTADASSLSDEINKSGHVAVYGIHFDTGKSAILPESEDSLKQILALLNQNAALKLRVEGHTDNQGVAAANQTLSEKRAQAVMGWLIANGVDASRLTAKGLGQTKPVAAMARTKAVQKTGE